MATSRRARSARVWPFSSAAPYSVTTTSTSVRADVTGPESLQEVRAFKKAEKAAAKAKG